MEFCINGQDVSGGYAGVIKFEILHSFWSHLKMSAQVQPNNYVGFDTITSQIEHRLVKRGFHFNLMLVGHSGLGKTTLVNTLFSSHLVDSSGRKSASEPVEKTSEIKTVSHTLTENNVRLTLNIIDTPGYGDQIDNDRW